MRIFGCIEPKVNLIFHFCTLYNFKYTDLWSPLAPLMGEIDTCACRLFLYKIQLKQLLCETIFDVIHIFGSVEAQSEFTSPLQYIVIFKIWTVYQPCDVRNNSCCWATLHTIAGLGLYDWRARVKIESIKHTHMRKKEFRWKKSICAPYRDV